MIGDEARAQVLEAAGRLPDRVIACVGGGSNAIGTFVAFVDDETSSWSGSRPRATGSRRGATRRPLTTGARGVLHGALSAVLQDEEGQVLEAHSISAGLDYPGSGPEHAWLRDRAASRYVAVADADALAAFRRVGGARGDHPGARAGARARVAARQPGATGSTWSRCRAAATRISPRCWR